MSIHKIGRPALVALFETGPLGPTSEAFSGMMPETFDEIIASVKRVASKGVASAKHKVSELPRDLPRAGVYLLSEDGVYLYVGRTNNIRRRLQYHTRNNHNQATFAFLLARHKTGRLEASYQATGPRADLLRDPGFKDAFDAARAQIRTMDVQVVEECDPVKQALLEIYLAHVTHAKYNDFDTH